MPIKNVIHLNIFPMTDSYHTCMVMRLAIDR